jgi:hypothetical protein
MGFLEKQVYFGPLNGQNGSKITPWTPYIQSSNLVIARSSRAGGTLIPMETPQDHEKIIRLLLPRLERISVDSYWAHRASGVRGALTKILERIEIGESINPESIKSNILIGFEILREAAQEYL